MHACVQKSLHPCPTLCDPMGCSPPGSSVHGIFQARILEWVAISSSRGFFRPRDQTCSSWVSCIACGFFTTEPPGKSKNDQARRYFLKAPERSLPISCSKTQIQGSTMEFHVLIEATSLPSSLGDSVRPTALPRPEHKCPCTSMDIHPPSSLLPQSNGNHPLNVQWPCPVSAPQPWSNLLCPEALTTPKKRASGLFVSIFLAVKT